MSDITIDSGHVYYFEPNDGGELGKDQDGQDVPLMAHMEDLCVSMTLTAEMNTRDKTANYNVSDQKPKYTRAIQWICNMKGETQTNLQLVNSGEYINNEKFLTTYYTEISADNYIDHELIEGLGITSVNIAYESWYTPTVTINFVDIHGSSLWGREEAIHDREGNLTSSNILGVFFQQPYPLFRLQVKGFLGHEVTYQLTCSGFKGHYNSQTGNFEATATFIGYSYSLLTDVPLKVLSYVSEMDYYGKQYWDEHCNDKDWEMINADGTRTPPVKLYQLIQSIKNAIKSVDAQQGRNCDTTENEDIEVDETEDATAEDNDVTLNQANKLSQLKNDDGGITSVETALNDFVKECENFAKKTHGGTMIEGQEETENKLYNKQLLLILANVNGMVNVNNIVTKYKTFVEKLKKYNEKNTNLRITNALDDNENWYQNNDNFIIKPKKIFKITYNKQKVVVADNKKLKELTFNINEQKKLFTSTVKALEDLLIYTDTANLNGSGVLKNNNGIGEYAWLISLGNMPSLIASIKEKVKREITNIESQLNSTAANKSNGNEQINGAKKEERKKKIIDIVGFEPTIGNFVKLVMCHLETFVACMMHCSDQIYADMDKRTFKNLGLNGADSTDIPDGCEKVYPWPALYNPNPKENSETKGNGGKYEMLGYPVDYKPTKEIEWEEQKLLLSAIDVILHFADDEKNRNQAKSYNYACLPMSGSDLQNRSPFGEVFIDCKDLEHLAPYLGLRIANIIGVGDYNCSDRDAEAIGYMDALNLISVSSDFKKLKEAVTSKVAEQDFATAVIKYLTCDSSSPSSSENDSGKKYNLFEILKNGQNAYDDNRDPMFKLYGQKYKYTYTYYKPNNNNNYSVSLVPTTLQRFRGNNTPYRDVFEPTQENDNKTYFNIKNGGYKEQNDTTICSQQFVYKPKTSIALPFGHQKYIHEEIFSVITDDKAVKTLLKQIDALKNGETKFKDYTVNADDKLTSFINRRFKTSLEDYYSIYDGKKHYNVLIPLISKVDEKYYKEHLYNSSSAPSSETADAATKTDNSDSTTEETTEITLDDSWFQSSDADLLRKLTVTVKKKTFNANSTECQINDLMIGELPLKTDGNTICSLFGCRLYYQQNNIEDEKTQKCAKAYLLLSSMMAGVDINSPKLKNGVFKNDVCSIIDYLPPFYVLFLGALLWRREYMDKNKTSNKEEDPINFTEFNCPNKNNSLISKNDYIFELYTSSSVAWYSIEDYLGYSYDNLDITVRTKLIKVFERFVNSAPFKTIIDTCELKDKDGKTIKKENWNTLKTSWNRQDFKNTTPSEWNKVFSNLWGNYSSVSPKGTTLRLLLGENNAAKDHLKYLYGITGGFIVGRGTAKKVGEENDTEVTVKESQIKGYLNGFKQRIEEAATASETAVKEESTVAEKDIDRDLAISLYYSLKQLWDAWLVSAAKDQFMIKNFFNKYFVFMDSFYVNMYNTIKLNCEDILDAYNTEKTNLLTFITNVATKERCMFFALPTFLDSNILNDGSSTLASYRKMDMSYKKENIRQMFTPYSFNDIGVPQPNNIFVFIYTHPYSSNASENTEKRFDSYMMNDQSSWPGQLSLSEIPDGNENGERQTEDYGSIYALPNNGKPDENDELISARYAYRMPCFGVAVNRGNNYIFKSINVNMVSPQITAVAADTYENILTKRGSDGTKRIFFRGQDIYNIYSQYSYSCEVEMLGCTQIQPLMYFQLLNIPMWRGTYMIYKVTHSMSPGNMTTKFVGMKMSRTQSPYASGYYTVGKNGSDSDKKNNETNGLSFSNNGPAVGGDEMFRVIANSTNITSQFKAHDGRDHYHSGVDIAFSNCKGKPLCAPWDGTISEVMYGSQTAGNWLSIDNSTKQFRVRLLHCDTIKVEQGQSVKYGEEVATIGNTGKGTGPHLHLELFLNGKFNTGPMPEDGGNGDYVNPSVHYGNLVGETFVATGEESLQGESNTSSSSTVPKNGITVIGDSWAEGLLNTNRFEHVVFKRGGLLNSFNNNFVPQALSWFPKTKMFVLVCGLNDLNTNGVIRVDYYKKMINKIISAKHKCCICTFPHLAKCNYQISSLNFDINAAAKACNIQVITVPESVIGISPYTIDSNVTDDGYHLKDWDPLAQHIINNIKMD